MVGLGGGGGGPYNVSTTVSGHSIQLLYPHVPFILRFLDFMNSVILHFMRKTERTVSQNDRQRL